MAGPALPLLSGQHEPFPGLGPAHSALSQGLLDTPGVRFSVVPVWECRAHRLCPDAVWFLDHLRRGSQTPDSTIKAPGRRWLSKKTQTLPNAINHGERGSRLGGDSGVGAAVGGRAGLSRPLPSRSPLVDSGCVIVIGEPGRPCLSLLSWEAQPPHRGTRGSTL